MKPVCPIRVLAGHQCKFPELEAHVAFKAGSSTPLSPFRSLALAYSLSLSIYLFLTAPSTPCRSVYLEPLVCSIEQPALSVRHAFYQASSPVAGQT